MDELNALGVEMERECLISTFRVLVDTVGSDVTIKLLRPYFELSGKAFALNLSGWTKDDDVFLKQAKIDVMIALPWGYRIKSFRVVNGEALNEREGCPFLGTTTPEFCEGLCSIMWGSIAKEVDPEVEIELTSGIGIDDPRCTTRYYHRTRTLLSDFDNRDIDIRGIEDQIPEEEIKWRAHHYAGGIWSMVTSAMVNGLGSEFALGSLSKVMHERGLSFGRRIKQSIGTDKSDLPTILSALETFSEAVMQKCAVRSMGQDEVEAEVIDCQWSSHDYSTPEYCHLIECINDGICKSINPDFEFKYSSMKTHGAEKCVWTLRRKSSRDGIQPSTQRSGPTEQDPISLLKIRLAKGEITLEEYEKISKVLR